MIAENCTNEDRRVICEILGSSNRRDNDYFKTAGHLYHENQKSAIRFDIGSRGYRAMEKVGVKYG